MNDRRAPVLEGARVTVFLTEPATDEEVLAALGKRVTGKLAGLWVLRKLGELTVGRRVI
jgi:hypothetical protein